MNRTTNAWARLDWFTVLLYLLLVIMGWLNIYAAVYSEEHKSIFDLDMRYGKQMLWIVAALFLAGVILFIDTRFYSFFAYIIYGLTILVLMAVLVFGKQVNGARSWFELGGGFHLQPSEFAKIGAALALAKYLSSFGVKIEKIKTLIIAAAIIMAPVALITMQPDFGSLIVYFSLVFVLYREGFSGWFLLFGFILAALFIISLVMSKMTILIVLIVASLLCLFLMNRRYKESVLMAVSIMLLYATLYKIRQWFHLHLDNYVLLLISTGVTTLGFVVLSFINRIKYLIWIVASLWIAIAFTNSVNYVFDRMAEHQKHRINILLGMESDPKGAEYNINQSKIAIGSGGFFGKGFLQGTQTKFNFVPEQSTDFIFCTVGEEWGFLGSLVVIALFVLLMLRLIFLAEKQRSAFSRIYGYGVVAIIFFHVAINVGMTIGVLPVIGIPLPFFSYGGSSLWSFTILLFIFLRFDASRLELLR
jgi:rod shape determining protein RodA